jgi:hypothetical protein
MITLNRPLTQEEYTNLLNKLIKYNVLLLDYNDLLSQELNEVAPIAIAHRWKSTRFEEGERLRNEINNIVESLQEITNKIE